MTEAGLLNQFTGNVILIAAKVLTKVVTASFIGRLLLGEYNVLFGLFIVYCFTNDHNI